MFSLIFSPQVDALVLQHVTAAASIANTPVRRSEMEETSPAAEDLPPVEEVMKATCVRHLKRSEYAGILYLGIARGRVVNFVNIETVTFSTNIC